MMLGVKNIMHIITIIKRQRQYNLPTLISFAILLHDAILVILDTAGQISSSSAVNYDVRTYGDC